MTAAVRTVPDREAFERGLVIVGAHAGAGASTLTSLVGRDRNIPVWNMGTIDRLVEGSLPPVQARGRPVVVVARNTVMAAQHAIRAVTALDAASGPRIAALVIVSDGAGREPRDATTRFALLQDRVGGLVRLPFINALRLVNSPDEVEIPARTREAIGQVWDLAFPQSRY
ncbi:hypothetical protein [Actinomadura hibisca]|uniref:hypothetical protein n=1 Tax=Actinomadura hibisca TaxID=68565 RepID=UPI00082C882A|nr:hypothetical protein [Actinomadura hibisca]